MNANDESWRNLLLWTDTNHDGISQTRELVAVAETSLIALETNYRWIGRRDSHGNLYRYQSFGQISHGKRLIYDVYFRSAD